MQVRHQVSYPSLPLEMVFEMILTDSQWLNCGGMHLGFVLEWPSGQWVEVGTVHRHTPIGLGMSLLWVGLMEVLVVHRPHLS